MIEYRATLLVDKKFEGGFKLNRGTVIYAREDEHGWLGMFYEEKGSGHGFALNDGDFSIWRSAGNGDNEVVLEVAEPPDLEEEARVRAMKIDQAQKRVDWATKKLAQETAELQALLGEEDR